MFVVINVCFFDEAKIDIIHSTHKRKMLNIYNSSNYDLLEFNILEIQHKKTSVNREKIVILHYKISFTHQKYIRCLHQS